MRITIDTTNKTIEIHEDTKLSRLVEELNTIFPNGTYLEYKLVVTTQQQDLTTCPCQSFNPYY